MLARSMFPGPTFMHLLVRIAAACAAVPSAAHAQPANDNCANATVILNGSVTPFNTQTATRDGIGNTTCLNFSAARDLWYSYTSSGAEHVVLDLCGSGPMVKGLAAFTGVCGSTTQLGCNRTGGCGTGQPQLAFDLPGAGTYLFYLATLQSSGDFSGILTLNASPLSGTPTADECSQAFRVGGDTTVSFDTAGLTTDGTSTCGGVGDGWYLWTPARSGVGTVTTCSLTSGDTVLAAFAGCGGTQLACNDDGCGAASQINFPVSFGTPVLVRIASHGGSAVSGQVRFSSAPALANDTCAGAQVLSGQGSVAVNSTFATTQGPSGSCNVDGQPDSHDLFFRYTAGNEGFITVDTLQGPASFDTTLQVFSACGGVELACNDDADDGTNASRTCPLAVTPGTDYIIRLATWGASSTGGATILRVASASAPVFAVPPGAIAEPGGECDEYADDVNFGCDLNPIPAVERKTAISLCTTYRGFAPARTNVNPYGVLIHDSDNYLFVLTVPSRITVVGQTQFKGIAFVNGSGCPVSSFFTPTVYPTPCAGSANFSFTTNETLQPGTYGFGIANWFDLSATCGHNDQYWFRITAADAPCTGACCAGTTCSITTASGCAGSFKGDGSTCDAPGNPTTCCPANFNGVGGVSVQDIFDFLSGYFGGDPRADFNGSGAVSVQDIFDFLAAYFLGCP